MATAEPGANVLKSQKYNIGQYRGLLDTVQHVKDKVEREREESKLRESGLQEQLKDKVMKGEKVQKELSVQLRCAGRSYAQILDANRELSEQMRVEIDVREDEIAVLKKVIKEKEKIIAVADKPWKEEIAKRQLQFLKMKEQNEDLKGKVYEESLKLPPVLAQWAQQISEKEAAMLSVLVEVGALNEQIVEIQEANAKVLLAIKAPFQIQILELQKKQREIIEVAEDKEASLKREIKKLENQKVGLQKELDKVDHTPYERKIDTLQDGFNRLVKDFEIKTQLNSENVSKMREGFEYVIDGLDRQIQQNEVEYARRLKPYTDELVAKTLKIEKYDGKIEEMKLAEIECREQEAQVLADVEEELGVAKVAVSMYLKELTANKMELEAARYELENDDGPKKAVKRIEKRLEEVTVECEQMVKHKDTELRDKNAVIGRLQKKLSEDSLRFQAFADMWDKRIQEKEKGFNKAIAELAFAEGQIVEERKRTAIEKEKVKARIRDIERLKAEHREELRVREIYQKELEGQIEVLEDEVEEAAQSFFGVREKLEDELDNFRRRTEERVADLRVEMARRDKLKEEVNVKLVEVQAQWVQARLDWEEKERELEVTIRTRDRTILALKNELEFLNDNWEIKYARLVNLYEKLQKKYEETTGANGVQEAFRRAQCLKVENEFLHTEIHKLRGIIQVLKAECRGLKLDIDQLMKETADLIQEKERGIAEMAGDFVRLENQMRDEQTLRARLLKQKDAERLALAESFQARVEQLEQIMEAMRFNDRQDLLDKIKLWKKNYERVCNERDEVEEYYKDLVGRKEKQLENMLRENDEERAKVDVVKAEWEAKLKTVEVKWARLAYTWQSEKDELEEELRLLKIELSSAQFQHDRQLLLNERPKEDPVIVKLRERTEELEEMIVLIEAGKQAIIDENILLSQKDESVAAEFEDVAAKYRPILAKKDKEMKLMMDKHEDLKDVLKLEMVRAQQTCKDIEEQVKRFPDPFLDEIQEMKDKYAQMQAGMQKIQMENLFLQEAHEKASKGYEKEIKSLEQSLSLAKTLLHEVSTMEALKHLHTSEARRNEDDLGLHI